MNFLLSLDPGGELPSGCLVSTKPMMMQIFPLVASVPVEPPPFPSRDDHPVPRNAIVTQSPISTNKFYANLFLGNRNQAVWLHPFSVWWSNEAPGSAQGWGLSVAHISAEQRAFGPDPNSDPVQYYINPIGIQSLCLSAVEFGPTTGKMSVCKLEHTSVEINLRLRSNPEQQNIQVPLVQGSGFISAIYNNLRPKFTSTIGFLSVVMVDSSSEMVRKWRVQLDDGNIWLLYAVKLSTYDEHFSLNLQSHFTLEGSSQFNGLIQVTKVSCDEQRFNALADTCAGTWATSLQVSASHNVENPSKICYTFDFKLDPRSGSHNLLMYALPHHVESFNSSMHPCLYPNLRLQSTTKGVMTAVVASRWVLQEHSAVHDIFCDLAVPSDASMRSTIEKSAREEIQGDPSGESNLDSMYFAGKALDKYASLCWVICTVLKDAQMSQDILIKVKAAFARFAENRQRFPLAYERAWGGLVSSGMYETGDLMQDFGNGCYNDHHFHYGYFIHAAALITKMDHLLGNGKSWLTKNKPFVDNLVRDTANANPSDPYFPLSRAFDWFHGHSWAKGLFESWDGKDQESTSEDAYFSYGLKLWGSAIGDNALVHRANLMLAIQKRVFKHYFLMESDNRNQPPQFVKNKVTGILFENKTDHTTYFGHDIRFIQGIHMIPVSPISRYIRSQRFVEEEWCQYFAEDHLTGDDGWKGILYSNYSIIQPKKAWNFFASNGFKRGWLDGGATRTWYLAICAHFMGLPPPIDI